jgi:fatty acid desaturase
MGTKNVEAKNIGAIAYPLLAYGLGIGLLIQTSSVLNMIGLMLMVHALIFSATLTHELIHCNLFKENRDRNRFWGQVMTHLNGACYATWENLSEHHFNHHLHHADFVEFDIAQHIKSLHPAIRWLYRVLEWAYFPIFEFELRWRIILAPFLKSSQRSLRWRAVGLMGYRTAAFGLLGWVAPKALVLYGLAYISFVNIMRFADAFHHTYDYAIVGEEFRKRDRSYEQDHTFSNLVSESLPWFNLLFLNFGYHNAHHHNMSCPWHELPQLHRTLYGQPAKNVMSLPRLMWNYHKFRLVRLCSGQGEVDAAITNPGLESFTGAVGVSFLTPPLCYAAPRILS